ncbi:MAG TPA: hemerythrin family protein [Alphaproteobacteria bacterium]|nr:hemerythrin family protein [Alphaproteobacteria bacterium]
MNRRKPLPQPVAPAGGGDQPAQPAAVPESFPWLDFLEIDNAAIDRDHREAVAEGNRLSALLKDRQSWPDVVAMLRQARARSARHFETEDRILAQTRFPEHEQHRRAHERILAELDRILAELEAVTVPEERHWQRAQAPRDLLVDHCLKDDLRFKSHVMQMGARRGW